MLAEAETQVQPVLAIRAEVAEDDARGFVSEALRDIHTFMREHHLEPAGPPFTISHEATAGGMVDLEAGWPVEHTVAGAGRIHGCTLPAAMTGRHVRPHPWDDRF